MLQYDDSFLGDTKSIDEIIENFLSLLSNNNVGFTVPTYTILDSMSFGKMGLLFLSLFRSSFVEISFFSKHKKPHLLIALENFFASGSLRTWSELDESSTSQR